MTWNVFSSYCSKTSHHSKDLCVENCDNELLTFYMHENGIFGTVFGLNIWVSQTRELKLASNNVIQIPLSLLGHPPHLKKHADKANKHKAVFVKKYLHSVVVVVCFRVGTVTE